MAEITDMQWQLEDLIKETVYGGDTEKDINEIMDDQRGTNFSPGHWVSGSSIAQALVEAYELGRRNPDYPAVERD